MCLKVDGCSWVGSIRVAFLNMISFFQVYSPVRELVTSSRLPGYCAVLGLESLVT